MTASERMIMELEAHRGDPEWEAAREAILRNASILANAERLVAPKHVRERVPEISRVDPNVRTEPIPPERTDWLYRTLHDPKLNRGLENLFGAFGDVMFGEPSGNTAVDLGASNIPGVGPAAILAAGGAPGILDIAGAGSLKNVGKIPKYTMEFVSKHFGEKGLRNLDNALSLYPKADKPSINDAIYIMRSGIGGETVTAKSPYSSGDVVNDALNLLYEGMDAGKLKGDLRDRLLTGKGANGAPLSEEFLGTIRAISDKLNKAEAEDNLTEALKGVLMFDELDHGNLAGAKVVAKWKDPDLYSRVIEFSKNGYDEYPELYDITRVYAERSQKPVQDWDKIIAKQERKDAEAVAKAEKKAAKKAEVKPTPVKERTEQIVKEQPPAPKVEEVVPEAPKVEQPKTVGGPNKWRENGWSSKQYDPNFYEKFGSRMSEESKRDMFVVDSLAKHWASKLVADDAFRNADIVNGLDRAAARHGNTNYDKVSQAFQDDVRNNIASGNMPGVSVSFEQKYRNNAPVPYMTTPTLKLSIKEKPKVYDSVRIWPDMAEGPDLYELLFRKMVDEKLHAANPMYWVTK